MTIQIDDKTFDNFASAVEHVKKTKPRIKDAEAYVSSIEQRVASINCPKTNLAKLKQRLAENVVIKRKSNFDKITGKLIPHDITDGDGTQAMVTSPKKGNKVVSTGGNKQLERIKKLQEKTAIYRKPKKPTQFDRLEFDRLDRVLDYSPEDVDGNTRIITEDELIKTKDYIENGTKIRPPKPTQKDRRRIIKAKLQKTALVRSPDKYKVDKELRHTRVDSNAPLVNKVPFGDEDRNTLRQFQDRQLRDSSYELKNKVYPPKPTQKDRRRIITAKQLERIKHLQNPKENLDKIKRRMAKLKQRLAVQGHFYGKDTNEVNHGDIITVKKGNNNINHYYKGNKKIFSDFWSDVKEGDSFKVNKDSVEGHDRVKLQKNARFDLINRRMYEAKEHKHYIQFKQAKRIGEVGEFKGATQEKYWKYWLLNAKQTNGNGWGVSNESIHANINKFIGRPFCVTAKQWFPESEYETYEHPYLPTNNLDTIFNHQAKYAAGDIVDIIREKDDYYAMIKPKAQFANQSPPAFCSPAIFQLDPHEPENKISKWEALHLAGLDRDPAYGAQIALLKGTCIGTKNECKVQFHVAKQRLATLDGYETNSSETGRIKKLHDYKNTRTYMENAGEWESSQHDEHMKQNEEYIDVGKKIYPKGSNAKMTHNMKKLQARLRISQLQKIAEYKLNSPEPVTINPQHGKIIADAYESIKHDPNHPAVKEAYGALIKETNNQFKELTNNGLKITKSNENIYKTSKDMHDDIEKNNHLYYFPTEAGFGQDKSNTDHPMLQSTEFKQEGNNLLANDVFRIVHDINGHHLGGKTSFGPKGEHQAYLQHSKMYSPLAKKALFTETAGQNNWVNFGPQGAHNRANPKETIYGQQKAGLLPDNIINGKHHQ